MCKHIVTKQGSQNNPTEWAQRLWDINDKEEELVNQLVAIQARRHRLQGQLWRDYEALEALREEGGSTISGQVELAQKVHQKYQKYNQYNKYMQDYWVGLVTLCKGVRTAAKKKGNTTVL